MMSRLTRYLAQGVCACACVRACVRVCVCVCWGRGDTESTSERVRLWGMGDS